MDLETCIYDHVERILRSSHGKPGSDFYALALVVDFPEGDPWRSVLYVLYDTIGTRRSRKHFAARKRKSEKAAFDKWSNLFDGIFWLPSDVDQLMPDTAGNTLRDAYLSGLAEQDEASLCRSLIDLCAGIIRKLHAERLGEVPLLDGVPIVLETFGVSATLQQYARDQGISANLPELEAKYRALLAMPRHRIRVAKGLAEIRTDIAVANSTAKELAEYVAVCRKKQPIPKLSELSPVERQQYQIIRTAWKNGCRMRANAAIIW